MSKIRDNHGMRYYRIIEVKSPNLMSVIVLRSEEISQQCLWERLDSIIRAFTSRRASIETRVVSESTISALQELYPGAVWVI